MLAPYPFLSSAPCFAGHVHAHVAGLPARPCPAHAKPWFEAHRESYENDVRVPMRALIEEMDVRLAPFAPEITDTLRSAVTQLREERRAEERPTKKSA